MITCMQIYKQAGNKRAFQTLDQGFPDGINGKESDCQCMRYKLDPWVEETPWRGKWQPLQYSCLGNPMDRDACGLQSVGSQSRM